MRVDWGRCDNPYPVESGGRAFEEGGVGIDLGIALNNSKYITLCKTIGQDLKNLGRVNRERG